MHASRPSPPHSADQILIAVQIVPDTISNLEEAILSDSRAGVAGRLGHTRSILQVCNLLHLADRRRSGILLTIVEGVILLRDLQTKDWVANECGD